MAQDDRLGSTRRPARRSGRALIGRPALTGAAIVGVGLLGAGCANGSFLGFPRPISTTTTTTEQVPQLVPTTTAVTDSPNPSNVNGEVSIAATVSANKGGVPPNAGTVTFTEDGGTPLGSAPVDANGGATVSDTFTQAGSFTIAASYSGEPDFAASTGTTAQMVSSQAP